MRFFDVTPGTPEGDAYWAHRRRREEEAERPSPPPPPAGDGITDDTESVRHHGIPMAPGATLTPPPAAGIAAALRGIADEMASAADPWHGASDGDWPEYAAGWERRLREIAAGLAGAED